MWVCNRITHKEKGRIICEGGVRRFIIQHTSLRGFEYYTDRIATVTVALDTRHESAVLICLVAFE